MAEPQVAQRAPFAVEVAPGETVDLHLGDWRVNGRKAHVWATSANRTWARFQSEDLWLVPEVVAGTNGDEHRYESQKMQTFVFYVQ